MKVKLANSITYDSVVDGPGLRNVIWFQGCNHNCPGCHNPETHDFSAGIECEISDIIKNLKKNYNEETEGFTISGGDPIFQLESLVELCEKLKKEFPNKTIWVYTGFTYEKLINNLLFNRLCRYIDVLVDGPFIMSKKDLNLMWVGSSNQRLIDIPKSIKNSSIVELK